MTSAEYEKALSAVKTAAFAYRGGLTNDDTLPAAYLTGTRPWTPIYLRLLAELKAVLEAAGQRYDSAADSRLADHADRFDWCQYLGSR